MTIEEEVREFNRSEMPGLLLRWLGYARQDGMLGLDDDLVQTTLRHLRVEWGDDIKDVCIQCEGTGQRSIAGRSRQHARCKGNGYLTPENLDNECWCGEDDPDELIRNGVEWICRYHDSLRDDRDDIEQEAADYALSLPRSEQ